jgi:hypothetical protein
MPARRRAHHVNIWAGRLIPLIIIGSTGYIIYAITVTIGRPSPPFSPQQYRS